MSSLLAPQPQPAAIAGEGVCAHCGLPLPPAASRFCCVGCAAAYELVTRLGLGQFYARRSEAAAAPARLDEEADDAAILPYVRQAADGTSSLLAIVDGLTCPACLWLIESALAQQAGVVTARLALSTGRLQLRWQGPPQRGAALLALVRRLGYRVRACDPALVAVAGSDDRALLRALAVAGFAAANIMLLSVAVWAGNIQGEMGAATRDLLHWVSALIALPAVAYAGRPFFRSAIGALRAGRTNMDLPISVGVLLATGMSLVATWHSEPDAYFDSAAMLLFFLLIGRYLERRARGRARNAAEALLALGAAPVTRLTANGGSASVLPAALMPGDTILVASGERIGADGEVVDGRSEVDRSLIDGESMPAAAGPGSRVHAGMTNLTAPLRIRVTATGEATFLAEIVRLMEIAEHARGRYVVLAERVARHYAPAVHGLALATVTVWLALGHGWEAALTAGVAVLIITCPCALGLAVPAVQVIAIGGLLRRGVLVKSASALERLAAVDTVVFDKTGTLTLGRPTLAGPVDADCLTQASALAAVSRHPLSRAIRALCPEVPAAEGVVEHPGAGLERGGVRLGSRVFCGLSPQEQAASGPELWLMAPGNRPVRFAFADALRPDAKEAIAWLRQQGMRVLLLSGDRAAAVAPVAKAVGIADWAAGLNPADKAARLAALAAQGRRTLMIGDGLNDAPALAAAHVSMSPGTAADVSQNAADIVFQRESLLVVCETISMARRSQALVRQNLAFSILYNAVAVPSAMLGLVTPLLAAAAMSASSLIVILNALRLHHPPSGAPT